MESDNGFRSFSREIESNPLGVLLAEWRRDAFIKKLKRLPDVVEVIPSGSLARGTQIGPVHDVDLIVVFDKSKKSEFGSGPEGAQAALTYLQGELLRQLHPLSDDLRAEGAKEGLVKDTEQRTHVVTCRGGWTGPFTDIIPSAPPVDVMPAVREGSHLLVPERGTGWIDVDPEKLMRQVAQRQREWKYFTEVVGMVKAWAENEKLGMKNLAVEVMVLKYCPRPGFFEALSCGEAVARFFEEAAKAHITSLKDPAGRSGKIDPDLDYEKLRDRLEHAARLARLAMEAEYARENPSRVSMYVFDPDVLWRMLFGKKYPRARDKAQERFWRDPFTEPWFGKYGRGPEATPGWDDLGPNGPGDHGPKDPHGREPKGRGDLGQKGPGWPAQDLGETYTRSPRSGAEVPRPAGIVSEPSDSRPAGAELRSAGPGTNLWTGVFRSAAVTVSVPLTFG